MCQSGKRMGMKNIGVNIGKFLLFWGMFAILLLGISKKIEGVMLREDELVDSRNKSYFRIRREPDNTIDIIVTGDSLSFTSVSPMELWNSHGFTSYVCGQGGQRVQESYYMLKNAFRRQSPRLVILESHMLFCGEEGVNGRIEGLKEALNYYFPFYRNHDMWKTLLTGRRYPEENYKGFAFQSEIRPYENGPYMEKTDQKEEITGLVLDYLQKIVELCRKNGTRLLLLSTPSPVNYDYKRHNSLEAYAREKGIDYLDLNLKDLGMDWRKDSLDQGDHLNYYGAEKVTRFLGEYLVSHYDLTDHRMDRKYTSWKDQAKEYMARRENVLEVRDQQTVFLQGEGLRRKG